MLLLVLILVLAAFGLLLVGFLSSSVLWAWVSVAVSVAAALVLGVDWMSRRSAVKAGEEPGGDDSPDADSPVDPTSSDGPTTAARYPDIEPATEVIPIIRSSAFGPPQVSYGMGAPYQGAPMGRRGSGVEPRFDPDADSQQTVMMPAVQPSGSASGPSGATPVPPPSSESSSPTVTTSPVDPSETPHDRGAAEAPTADRPAAAEATVVVPAAGTSPSVKDDAVADDGPTTGASAAADGTAGATGGGEAHSGAGTSGAGAAAGLAFGTGSAGPDTGTAPPGAPQSGTPQSGASQSGNSQSGASQAGASQAGVSQAGVSQPGVSQPGSAPPAGTSGEQRSDVTESSEAGSAGDGEAPEERPDAAAASLVAGLEDEVLVIDEQPRFHVPGCRALLAAPLIPLPVGEAVELGFTPCGWCTPVRTLSSRYPATAR